MNSRFPAEDQEIKSFIDAVLEQVKFRQAHPEIESELMQHLEDFSIDVAQFLLAPSLLAFAYFIASKASLQRQKKASTEQQLTGLIVLGAFASFGSSLGCIRRHSLSRLE